jgi:hypothetical protein
VRDTTRVLDPLPVPKTTACSNSRLVMAGLRCHVGAAGQPHDIVYRSSGGMPCDRRARRYSALAIEMGLALRLVSHKPLRQSERMLRSIVELRMPCAHLHDSRCRDRLRTPHDTALTASELSPATPRVVGKAPTMTSPSGVLGLLVAPSPCKHELGSARTRDRMQPDAAELADPQSAKAGCHHQSWASISVLRPPP